MSFSTYKVDEQTRIALQKELQNQQIIKNCVNCDDFDTGQNICKKFNATPPATVIVVGCEHWVPDIPF